MDLITVLGAILAIGFLIVVHEAGHYFVARWCNMRVDRFSVGFGPAIFKKRYGETDFTIGPIPFGGFVQINGMLLAEEVDADDPRAYPNRPVWQRFATIFAGPATNYLAAIALAFVLYAAVGVPTGAYTVEVDGVASGEGFDAEGKLERGDVITAVDGEPIKSRSAFIKQVQVSDGKPLALSVTRAGADLEIAVVAKPNPKFDASVPEKERKQPAYRIGVVLLQREVLADVGVFRAAGNAVVYPFRETKAILTNLYEMATVKEVRKDAQLSSVVGITHMTKKALDAGFASLLRMLMILNVFLGLFNLFPLPALDGGRLVFLGYEMVTRRRANPKIEATVHMVGIMALMLLLIVVTYGDIKRLIAG